MELTQLINPNTSPTTDQDWMLLSAEIGNYFTPSGPIDEEKLFQGRLGQVISLLETALERSMHAILWGERGVGKTSLANVFWKRYHKSLETIIAVRVQALPSDDFPSLWKKALEELKFAANRMGKSDLIPIDTSFDELHPDQVRRELSKIRPNAIPIIILDEFDKLRDREAKELTANLIKALSDYAVNCTLILVGVAEDIEEMISDHASINRCLREVKLDRMVDDELREIIESRCKLLPMTIDNDAMWKIIKLSRGLPYYVHSIGKYAFKQTIRDKRLKVVEGDVDVALDKVIEDRSHSFFNDYLKATTSNQTDAIFEHVLLACAIAETDEAGFFTQKNVIAPLTKILGKESDVNFSTFQRHLTEWLKPERGSILMRRGEARQYRFRFTDPMMQPYIVIKGIRDQKVPDAIKSILSHPEQHTLPI